MAHHTSRSGQRVDKVSVTDEPHDLYRGDGTPVLVTTKKGMVLEKAVMDYTVSCPDCDTSGRYTRDSEPVCPNCGLVLTGGTSKRTLLADQIVRDAKAAGRVLNDSNY